MKNPKPILYGPRVNGYRTDLVKFSFRSNQRLAKEIDDLTRERHTTTSDTLRLLLDLGLKTYRINKTAGNTTGEKAQQARNVLEAQAEAAQAQRERKRQGKATVATVLSPILFGDDIPPDDD
jgi:hypothetical protein